MLTIVKKIITYKGKKVNTQKGKKKIKARKGLKKK